MSEKHRTVNCKTCVQHPELDLGIGLVQVRWNPNLYSICPGCEGAGTRLAIDRFSGFVGLLKDLYNPHNQGK